MLAYGNFGRPSTVEAATAPQTLRIVAAPLDAGSPVPTGVEHAARVAMDTSTKLASTDPATLIDPAPTTSAAPAAADPQMADDAAAAGMTAHVQADSSTLG